MYQTELSIIEAEISALLDKKGANQEQLNELPKKDSLIENLKTIPGVSETTIATVISECGDLTRFTSIPKFIGYLSKRGSSLVKHALYMSVTSCLIHNKQMKQLYDTKRSQGKSKKRGTCCCFKKTCNYNLLYF